MDLPPALRMITAEMLSGKLVKSKILKLLKDRGFLREISTQAQHSTKKDSFYSSQDGLIDGLNVYPTAALNPLARFGKCNAHECRIIHAESFARSIGLYCDNAVLTDFMTADFV